MIKKGARLRKPMNYYRHSATFTPAHIIKFSSELVVPADVHEKWFYNGPVGDSVQMPAFRKPSAVEAVFNRALGFLVGLGIGPGYMQLLQVRGRKTGQVYSTPGNLLQVGGKPYLVAPRGRTQWMRNAEATGEIVLKRGSVRRTYRLRPVSDSEKPEILKLYLDSYKAKCNAISPCPPARPPQPSATLRNYPVFELLPA